MVFHQSDSTGTLVSLDRTAPTLVKPLDGTLAHPDGDDQQQQQQQQYVQTSLLVQIDEEVSSDDYDDDMDFEDDDNCWIGRSLSTTSSTSQSRVLLYLPARTSDDKTTTTSPTTTMKVDEYFNQLPYFQESCDELLSVEPYEYKENSQQQQHREQERILYVGQGERASSTTHQTDVLVSDRATTCHILAFRSTSTCSSNDHDVMASMAHLDGTQYAKCIHQMIRDHVSYHQQQTVHTTTDEEEKKADDDDDNNNDINNDNKVTIEIHIMGGFNDDDGTSSKLSEWLIWLLADLASSSEFSSSVNMVLKTCAITSMNDTGYSCPVGRGLAMNISTGRVYLAKCDDCNMGPASVLRSVYLWTSPTKLRCIHTAAVASTASSQIIIEPFDFVPFEAIPTLLQLDDHSLLKCTSTSPTVEEDGFCTNVRQSLRFMYHVSSQQVFGPQINQPLIFERRSSSSSTNNNVNEWRLVQ